MIIETQIKHDETQDWLWPTTAAEGVGNSLMITIDELNLPILDLLAWM